MITSWRSGVTFGLLVERIARYWMYRELKVKAPGAAMGCQADQVPSSASGVLPVRTLRAALVPAGVAAFHCMLFQLTSAFASNTRDWKVPDAAYGVSRIQSITMLPPKMLKSL